MAQYTTPPIVRHTGPMIDAHVHLREPAQSSLFVEMAAGYGVNNHMGIADLTTISACRRAFPGRIHGLLFLRRENFDHAAQPVRETLDLLRHAVEEEDIRGVKFWFKPQFNADANLYWDDARLDHIFDFMVEHHLVALVHISDPDIWFERVYGDASRFLTKQANYDQLENRLRRHPGLKVQAAHLGGDPEHLDHLTALLQSHPNLYFDLSATKWIARELSRQAGAARDFIIRWADRLLWGSDLVVGRHSSTDIDAYATRYYVHRHLWEGEGPMPSPIPDPDADGPVTVQGLNLPLDTLDAIYRRTAESIYRLRLSQ